MKILIFVILIISINLFSQTNISPPNPSETFQNLEDVSKNSEIIQAQPDEMLNQDPSVVKDPNHDSFGAVGDKIKLSVESEPVAEKLAEIYQSPIGQSFLDMMSNQKFFSGLNSSLNHSNLKLLLIFELFYFLFILIFRTWRGYKAHHWIVKFWINLWTSGLYIVGALILLPLLLLGSSFKDLVLGFFEYAKSTYF